MSTITTKDGVEIFYKDWGTGQPIVFSHGWPLSADDWDAQMMFFLGRAFASSPTTAAATAARPRRRRPRHGPLRRRPAALTAHLDLQDAVHVGHSTGGGEVARYLARHGESRVAKAVLISAVPPLMVKTRGQSGRPAQGRVRRLPGADRAPTARSSTRTSPAGPFYGFNRPGAKPSEGVILNWWRQGMMGGAKAHYDGIVAFSQTDFTEDLKKINVPVLVMHGDDDQIVPYADSAPLSAKLLKNGTLEDLQGLPARHADDRGRHDQRRPAGVRAGMTR